MIKLTEEEVTEHNALSVVTKRLEAEIILLVKDLDGKMREVHEQYWQALAEKYGFDLKDSDWEIVAEGDGLAIKEEESD